MKINQLKAGVILSYATQLITILTGLIYTPVMLRLLGESEYGLYQLVYSVVSYLGLLSFGFGTGYMRFYARFKVQENDSGIARLNGMFMTIFSFIAAVCLLCGIVMVANAETIFAGGLSDSELSRAKVLMAIMVVNMALSFVMSVFMSYITAHERFFFQRIIEFLRALFNPFLVLPLLIMGYGSVAMVLVSTFLTVSALIVNVCYCVFRLNIRFSFKGFDFSLLREMFVFTFFIFINMIVDQLNWNVDKLLLGRMSGAAAVGVYSIAAQLNTMYLAFSTNISSVFTPRVNMIVASKEDNSKLTELFVRVGRAQFAVVALIISGFILFGKEFIVLWAGEGYSAAYRVGLFLMIPVTIPMLQNVGLEIQRAKNMHRVRSLVYLAIAVSNIFVSIPCIEKWGIEGAAFGTALTLILGNGIFMNVYYHKRIGLDIIYFWKQIIKMLPALLIAMAAGYAVNSVIPGDGIAGLLVNIIIYTVIYVVAMWFIGLSREEKKVLCSKSEFLKNKYNY